MSTHVALSLDLLRVVAFLGMVLATATAWRYRAKAVAKPFVLLLAAMTAWAALTVLPDVLGVALPGGTAGAVLAVTQFVAAVVVFPLWLTYVRRYAGRQHRSTRRSTATVVAPVLVVAALAVARSVLRDQVPALVSGGVTVAVFALFVYLVALFIVGVYLLVRLAGQYRQLAYRQVATLTVAVAAPYLLFVVSSLSQPTEGGGTADVLPVDVTFAGFLVAAPLLVYAIRRYPLFSAFPESDQVARDEVVEELTEAVLLLNGNDEVIDANAAAARLVPRDEDLVGRPVRDVLGDAAGLPGDGVRELTLQTDDGPRQFEVSSSEIEDGDGGVLGRTLLFRDVTRRETREQQLEVLTRVLRHNLRNDLDAALAYAEEVEDPDVRRALEANIGNITDTARKARTIEDVLSTARDSYDRVDAVDVVREVAADFRSGHPDCEITVTAPAELVVVSHRRRLVQCLTELVENAVTHADGPGPAVEIGVAVADAGEDSAQVEFTVADDGPGIPDRERRILEAGPEGALEHSTGLGLWLAQWIATSLDGTLSLDRRDPTGSVATVRIHAEVVRHRADGE